MKYIKTFEDVLPWWIGRGTKWKNIIQKDGKLYVYLYKLSSEMEECANNIRENRKLTRGGYSIPGDNKIVSDMEIEYYNLVRSLLDNKVISFDDADSESHFGLCFNVAFESGPFSEGSKKDNEFQFEYLCIKLEDEDEYYNINEEVVVHLDIAPETYKNKSKFNL